MFLLCRLSFVNYYVLNFWDFMLFLLFLYFIFYIFDCNFIVFFVVYLMQSSAEMLTVCLNYIFIISNIINQNVLISKMNF